MAGDQTPCGARARAWRAGGRGAAMALGGLATALLSGTALAGPAMASSARTLGHATGAGGTVGTVASVDRAADTFTVKTASGSAIQVKVTKATSYREGAGSASFADVTVGESVAVIGTTSHGVETASIVVIGKPSTAPGSGAGGSGAPGGPGGFFRGSFGTVTSVDRSAGTFKLKTRIGSTVEVKVTKSTQYRGSSGSRESFSDVKVGETVAVQGTTTKGVETATTVLVGIGNGGNGGGFFGRRGTFGTVTSVDRSAGTFKLKTRIGSTVEVKVTKSTVYRGSAGSGESFSDVKVGETVAVQGTTTKGVETAILVLVGVRPPGA